MFDELAHYNAAMEQSLADKLFFLDHIAAETYVDFGCANGALLRGIASRQVNPAWQGFGIDISEFQLAAAGAKFPAGIYATHYDLIKDRVVERKGKKAAIFSSILHEAPDILEEAADWADYIVVRDMGITQAFCEAPSTLSMAKACQSGPGWKDYVLRAEVELWPPPMGQLTEYLLKAPYLTDPTSKRFERELSERYPLVRIENLLTADANDFHVIHFEHYSLPFIRDRIKRQFGFDFPYPTHFKLILQKVPK